MAPVLAEFERFDVESRICVTAQHREMLDSVLGVFRIVPDYDLNIMKPNQSLFYLTSQGLLQIEGVLESERPDIVLVQGDATSAFIGALAAFYNKIPLGHIEAGLRSFDKYSPFPEEMNRILIDHLADLHFAPTEAAKRNLLKEGIKNVYVTGNTVIDALKFILKGAELKIDLPSKFILVTVHRRESFGEGIKRICEALKIISKDTIIIFPLHRNPNVRCAAESLRGVRGIRLLEPLDYSSFVHLMNRSYLILTDSGGVQEEASALGKPVLVLRERTDRPEAIEEGVAELVGTGTDAIVEKTQELLKNKEKYQKMAKATKIYGDGGASKRIVKILLKRKIDYRTSP